MGDGYRVCAWCGAFPHKPNCKALTKPVSTKAMMEAALGKRTSVPTVPEGPSWSGVGSRYDSFAPVEAHVPPPPPEKRIDIDKIQVRVRGEPNKPLPPEQEKKIRTDLQRRFDAIAEDVFYGGGSVSVRGDKLKS